MNWNHLKIMSLKGLGKKQENMKLNNRKKIKWDNYGWHDN